MRRIRTVLRILILVLVAAAGLLSIAVVVTETGWFKNWLRGYIVGQANQYLNASLSIDRLSGDLFFGIRLEHVTLMQGDRPVVTLKDLRLDYSVFQMASKGLSINAIQLNEPVVYLRREADGWSISHLLKKQRQEAGRRGPAGPITIDKIEITNGSVAIDGQVRAGGVILPTRVDRLDATMAFAYEPVRFTVDINRLSFHGEDPTLEVSALSGKIGVRNETVYLENVKLRTAESSLSVEGAVEQYESKPVLRLQVRSERFSLPELAQIVPALGPTTFRPAFDLELDGPLDRLKVDVHARSSAGQIAANVLVHVGEPRETLSGRVSVRGLDLAPIVGDPRRKSDMTVDADVEVRGRRLLDVKALEGTIAFTAPHVDAEGFVADRAKGRVRLNGRRMAINVAALAYGATATASGDISWPMDDGGSVVFDLRGSARQIDLERLPRKMHAPVASTRINAATYHVLWTTGSGANRPDRVSGDVQFERSTVAGAEIAGGSTVSFTVAGADVGYRVDATVSGLDLERVGREFAVPVLATERYRSAVNGHVVADVRGTTIRTLALQATGELTETALFETRFQQMTFDTTIADETAHVKAKGRVVDFDPAVTSGKQALEGHVAGTFDVDAQLNHLSQGVSTETVEATVRADVEPSTVAGLSFDRLTLDGNYRRSTGAIRTLEVVGRDLNLTASGTLALDDTGQSNLTVHANTSNLERIGQLVGRPLAGLATLDAVVTGNRRELQAKGRAIADAFKYGDNGALTVSADYTVTIPDLTAARATVVAQSHAALVVISGETLNELNGKVEYTNQQITFDLTATQPKRTVTAAGSLVIHPDHNEVHLQRLSLATQGLSWETPANTTATLRYGGHVLSVRDFELANGDQHVKVDGEFGSPEDALAVTFENVDAAALDALLLRPSVFSGRLSATGTVSGTKDAPEVNGEFHITQGGIQMFRYESLAGTVRYGGRGVTVDARLQQNASQWLTAKGYVPVAAFRSGPVASNAVDVPREERFDLHIESAPFELGLLQGFTTAISQLKGLVAVNVDLTGTARDPRPTGAITIQDAAFKVESTGVVYTGLGGKIDLQPDRIHIDEIRIIDDRKQPLTVTGDLAVRALEVGGINITVKADEFRVIANEDGDIRVKTDLRIGGELRAPRIEGDVELSSGTLNLDVFLAKPVYSVKPSEFVTAPPGAPERTMPPSVLDALAADVHLTIPDALVVKASDLKSSGTPISLGAVNVTVGGDLQITKAAGDAVRILGYVNTVRGYYDFQGRRFSILRWGMIHFDGQTVDDLDPRLEVNAERVIQEVTANVWVGGSMRQPEILLTSTPPLDQSDLLALIVFNQPLNQLAENQQISLTERARSTATGLFASQLASSLAGSLNLDQFEINLAPASGGPAEVTVGQQLGQNLFVKVQRGIGEQSLTNLIVEYQFTPWVQLRTNVLQGSSVQQQRFLRTPGSGIDLLFSFGLRRSQAAP